MSYGSYYEAPYYKNPVPYTSSDIGEPVPGWGVNPNVAGPARVGIGQVVDPSLKLYGDSRSSIIMAQQQVQQSAPLVTGGQVIPGGEEHAPAPGMSTNTKIAIAAGVVALLGLVAYKYAT